VTLSGTTESVESFDDETRKIVKKERLEQVLSVVLQAGASSISGFNG